MSVSPSERAVLAYCAHGLEPLAAIVASVEEELKKIDQITVLRELASLVAEGYLDCYLDSGGSMTPTPAVTAAQFIDQLNRPKVWMLMGIPLAGEEYCFETTDRGLRLTQEMSGEQERGSV